MLIRLWLLQAIDGLDADVLTIENSRSGNEMIVALAQYGYKKDVGPGVYDVHSPVVPRSAPCATSCKVHLCVIAKLPCFVSLNCKCTNIRLFTHSDVLAPCMSEQLHHRCREVVWSAIQSELSVTA